VCAGSLFEYSDDKQKQDGEQTGTPNVTQR
jgi:hypothetical protein